jgi:hypothetical protein
MPEGLGYTDSDLERIRELAGGTIERAKDVERIVDSLGYLADWRSDYKIQSVRSSLQSGVITCIDAAILAYGLFELFFPHMKRRLLAIHRRDAAGEEVGHCVTLYWDQAKVGAISKSSFALLHHREPVFEDERAVALSFAQSYLKMNITPLYYGVTSLEEVAGSDLDWRFSEGNLVAISDRLIERYEYAFDL